MNGRCPECDVTIEIDGPEVGEILDCAECGVEFEVITVTPLEFSIIADDDFEGGEWDSGFGSNDYVDEGTDSDDDDDDDDDSDDDDYEKDINEDDDLHDDLGDNEDDE